MQQLLNAATRLGAYIAFATSVTYTPLVTENGVLMILTMEGKMDAATLRSLLRQQNWAMDIQYIADGVRVIATRYNYARCR